MDLTELKRLFARGVNISQHLRERYPDDPELAIRVSYDVQAGSYVRAIEGEKNTATFRRSMQRFAEILDGLECGSILEAGVGEGTTLASVIQRMKAPPAIIYGFDISLSRLLYAQRYCQQRSLDHCKLFCGRLQQIPLPEDSVDIVFTSHAIEPNRGLEEEIIAELYRICRRYLVLREPSWELGGARTRAHIEKHHYARQIQRAIDEGGYSVLDRFRWGFDFNPENETAMTIIEKRDREKWGPCRSESPFVCPAGRHPLLETSDGLYCEPEGLLFPIVRSIPALLLENGVLCGRYLESR